MEQKSIHPYIAAGILAVVLFFTLLAFSAGRVSEDEMKKIVQDEMAKLNIPSAADIAANVNVEVPEFPEIPEFKSDEQVKDLWEDMYSINISELKDMAYNDAFDELDDEEELEDFLISSILNFDKIERVTEDEVEVEVISLGIGEDEDKEAQIVFELEVRYLLTEGPVETYKKKVVATANVFYPEGDFDEPEVELVFA